MQFAVNNRLASAMVATRAGWALPQRIGAGTTGELFMLRMQAAIAENLAPNRLARYTAIRDMVRDAVRILNGGDLRGAGELLRSCFARLPELADDAEVEDLARSWIDQAQAYLEVREGNPEAAENRLRLAMDSDTRLEQIHGYELMHIGRINTVHLWLRVLAVRGEVDAALDCVNAVVAYVNGRGDELPFGEGWSRRAAARIPADLTAAMTFRVSGEAGIMLAGMDRKRSAAALARLPALQDLDPESFKEISDWVLIKRDWAEGNANAFLSRVVRYLAEGRRETPLWYAALLDFCRVAGALRPDAARAFHTEVTARAQTDAQMPRLLGKHFRQLADDGERAPWVAAAPSRRFHLLCVGLPRSGVVSLCTLFRNFHAANEYAEAETIQRILDHRRGRIDDEALRAHLRRRDGASLLEMDAASFLHLVAEPLVEIHPQAKFVLPIREPAAWFESYMRELLRVSGRFQAGGAEPPAWFGEYAELLLGRFDWREITDADARRAALPDLARRFLTHWAEAIDKLLEVLPPARTLIVRTEDLEPMRDRIAAFVGQASGTLTGAGHSNASAPGPSPLDGLPEGWLARAAADICGPTRERALQRRAR